MLMGINRIKIKNETNEFRLDLALDLKKEPTDEEYSELITCLVTINLDNISRQDPELYSFEEDLAVHVVRILIEKLDAEMFKLTFDDTGEYYFENDSNFLQKREGERMAWIPMT